MSENVVSDCCENCAWCKLRPDMKNIKYCVKRNFPIFDTKQKCVKHRKVEKE